MRRLSDSFLGRRLRGLLKPLNVLVVRPYTFSLLAVLIDFDADAVSLIVKPEADVLLAVFEGLGPMAIVLTFAPGADVKSAIGAL